MKRTSSIGRNVRGAGGSSLLAAAALLAGAALPFAAAVQTVPVLTGFEAPEYSAGNLAGQNAWTVEGAAVVQTGVAFEGSQAVEIGSNSAIDIVLGSTEPVVWIDGWVRTAGSATPPPLETTPPRSSMVFFGTAGVQGLNGNGSGGGSWVNAGPALGADGWTRVSIRQDYAAKNWDLYLDGQVASSALGFKDNAITQLSGFKQVSEGTSYLDAWSATAVGFTDDTDTDLANDLDELKLYDTDPTNPDTDGDKMLDGHEIAAGTDPNSAASVFVVMLQTPGPRVQFQTLAGRLYTLQFRDALNSGEWQNVSDPAFVNRAGDGAVATYTETADADNRYYRAVVTVQ